MFGTEYETAQASRHFTSTAGTDIWAVGGNEPESVRKEAKKVEHFFNNFQAGEYVKYAATASIGVAVFPHEGADFETLYKAADQGVYKAKKRGKNQLAFYRDEWAEPKSE